MAVSIGMAKPMPTLPPPLPPVSICELMPITRPAASSSGPPELPGLIAASVWMHVVDLEAVGRLDLPLQGRDDAGRQRALEAERVADRDRRVADLDAVRAAERERGQLARRRLDLQHREVGRLVAPDDLRVDDVLVGELDGDLRRALDDVRVREDRAVAVDDEARAGRLAALLLGEAEVERRLRVLDDLRADEDDARGASRL